MTANCNALPLPSFYNPGNAGLWSYRANAGELLATSAQWAKQYGIRPAGTDTFKFHALIIDAQKDFCLPEGTLFVGGSSGRGAINDSARTAEFIYRNLARITNITTTLDTHLAHQIFTQSFWLNETGKPVPPYTLISTSDITSGKIMPNRAMAEWLCQGDYDWLVKQVEFYTRELERQGKYALIAWPPHCILGSDGHALVGVIDEARLFHSYTRSAQSNVELKGSNPFSENYSVFRPEVLGFFDGRPNGEKNTHFLKTLLESDAVAIFGQADSHCVASSIDDLLAEILATDPALANKVYVVTDCMSSVVTPGMDFTPLAERAHEKFADAGMHLVKSTDPVESWPGINL